MRNLLAALAFLAASIPAYAQGNPRQCPADAEQAGYSLWAAGTIKAGEIKRGRHACGRQIECTGAQQTERKRACRWL